MIKKWLFLLVGPLVAQAVDTFPIINAKVVLVNPTFATQSFVWELTHEEGEEPTRYTEVVSPSSSKTITLTGRSGFEFIYLNAYLQGGGTKLGASIVASGGSAYDSLSFAGGIPFSYDSVDFPTTIYRLLGADILPDGLKTIWATADEALTGALYREGVDKMINAVGAGGSSGSGVSGGGGDVPVLSTENSEALAGATIDALALVNGLGDMPPVFLGTLVDQGAAAGVAAAEMYAAFPTVGGLGYDVSSDGLPSILQIQDPFSGKVYDFNPFSALRMGGVASWYRQAMAWLVLVLLAAWVWNELDVKAYNAGTVEPAKGNPVVGGTGAQATSLVLAAALMVLTITLGTALVAWSFGDITMPVLYSNLTSNPMAGIPSGVAWMLDQLLPVATIISALVARVAWKIYSVPLWTICSMSARFLVF